MFFKVFEDIFGSNQFIFSKNVTIISRTKISQLLIKYRVFNYIIYKVITAILEEQTALKTQNNVNFILVRTTS